METLIYANIVLAIYFLYKTYVFKRVEKRCHTITNNQRVQLFSYAILLLFYIVLGLLRLCTDGPITQTELNFWKIWDLIMMISANIYIIGLYENGTPR